LEHGCTDCKRAFISSDYSLLFLHGAHVCDFFNLKIFAKTQATNADNPETITKLLFSAGTRVAATM